MSDWNEQSRTGLSDNVAMHLTGHACDAHVAIFQRQAAAHPCVEPAIGFGMDMPEARVDLGERRSMFRAELHDSGHVLGASRSHSEGKGISDEPMLRHVKSDRLIALAL